MRVPPFGRFRRFTRLSAVFVLGMVAGAVVYNTMFLTSYDALWLKYQDAEVQIKQYEEDIRTLKKYSNKPTVIKEIKVRTEETRLKDGEPEIEPAVVKEVVRSMAGDLEALRGRSVFDIDTDGKMVRLLLDRKRYTVREKEYEVQIRTMLVMEGVLQIWAEVKIHKGG
ncbi:hypothetical protein ACE6ED_02935 [Paenibacillus sp. CN-4]|uniref:hypothetical protein n=1 Tax=Paenibacillus nanchangensis TaxID=3348343 RepID=UPI003977E8A6